MKTPLNLHVVLAGFSGSGKSTTLAELARLVPDRRCLDLDGLVSDDVPALIAREGWPAFRRREVEQLQLVLQNSSPSILALGGGSLEQGWAVLEKASGVQVIHLDCSFEVCWRRIQNHPNERPLVQLGEARLRELFEERKPLYARCPLRVDATLPAREVALAILRLTGLA